MAVSFAALRLLDGVLNVHSALTECAIFFLAFLLTSLLLRPGGGSNASRTEYVAEGSRPLMSRKFRLQDYPGFTEVTRDGDSVSYMDDNGVLIRTKIMSDSVPYGRRYPLPLFFLECAVLSGLALMCLYSLRLGYFAPALESAKQGAAREGGRVAAAFSLFLRRVPKLASSLPLVTLRQGLQSFVLKQWAAQLSYNATHISSFIKSQWNALQSGGLIPAISGTTVTEAVRRSGVVCAGGSILSQLILRFRFQEPEDRKSFSTVCKQLSVAAFLFWLAAWTATLNEGGTYDIGMTMVQCAFLYVLMWIFWILSTIGYYGISNETAIFSSMRGFCLRFALVAFLVGCVLRA